MFDGQSDLADQRVGPDADAPDEGPCLDELPVVELDALRCGLGDGCAGADVHASSAQYAVGGVGEPAVQFGQDPWRDVDEQPARGGPPLAAGLFADQGVGVELALGGDLGARVARADHHEGGARLPHGAVVGGGEFYLAGDVVAQVQGLGQAPEAVGVLGDAGDRQQFVDAADGEDEPVVGQLAGFALGAGVPHEPLRQVDVVRLAEYDAHPRQRPGQGDGDPARLQDPGGHLGQEREVEEVVGRVEQDDLGLVPYAPAERTGGLETGESGSYDNDARTVCTAHVRLRTVAVCPVRPIILACAGTAT